MADKSETKKLIFSSSIIGLLITGLFLIANSHAQTQSGTDSTNTHIVPTTQKKTQIQIMGGGSGTITGTWNNGSTPSSNSCGSLGQYYAINNVTETASGTAVQDISYQYTYEYWGVTYPDSDTASQMLVAPATYNLNCIVNEPQVQWQ